MNMCSHTDCVIAADPTLPAIPFALLSVEGKCIASAASRAGLRVFVAAGTEFKAKALRTVRNGNCARVLNKELKSGVQPAPPSAMRPRWSEAQCDR